MSYKRSGGSSYFGRGGAGSDDDEDEDIKVMKEGESDSDADETVSVISDDGAPILDEDEEGADAANEGASSDVEEEEEGEGDVDEGDGEGDIVKPEEEEEEEADDNDSDMTDAYDSDEDMESGEIDETKPMKRVPRQKAATTIDATAIMGGPSSNPGIQALLDDTINSDGSDEESNGEDESYLQKFNTEIKKNYVVDNHPECVIQNYHEIVALSVVVRDKYNNVIDGLHRTCPYLSKFEKTRVLGQRAMQINAGAPAFIKVPENIVDGYLIAEIELTQKKIPFIIRRPLPNGGSEYWKLSDLEDILF
jgi:DNA-directed RNA polymerase I, II, and III subunit RPABC2